MKKFLSLSVGSLLIAGAVLTSCSDNDKTDNRFIPSDQEEAIVQITVRDQNTGTRAYTGTEDAVTGEVELADNLSVYVYEESGAFAYQQPVLSVDASGKTDTFKVTKGMKYFYIFSNAQDKPITDLTKNWNELEQQKIFVEFENNKPKPMADFGAMAIGTLWRGDNYLNGNLRKIEPLGYGGDPVQLELMVGRAVAKIRVADIKKETVPGTSPLTGTFDKAIYRLRSVPNIYYLVGQLDGSGNYPPTTGLRYISAVHDIGPGTSTMPSNDYVDYFWKDAFEPKPALPLNYDHYYTIENTSQMMESQNVKENHLYYGNTTYVQFRIEYTPGPNEVYDPDNMAAGPDPAGLTSGITYWTALYTDPAGTSAPQRLIFSKDPTGKAGFEDPKTYTNGIMYYKFPVRDQRESGTERQCCVIRNHYYEISVNNIFNLGEPTDEVDPEEPIDDIDPNVQINVKVLDWFKVEQGEDL